MHLQFSGKGRNILLGSCTSGYYYNAYRTQVASIHRNSIDAVDEIIVYDLGLSPAERDSLDSLKKVKVVDYPSTTKLFWEGYLSPRQFAWKCFILREAKTFGENVLYLDAGAMALSSLQTIYDIIKEQEIFFSFHAIPNSVWCHQKCLDIMKATEKERSALMIWAGALGYKAGGRYQPLIEEAFEYSKIRDCIWGTVEKHRNDQSIYSILVSRYDCPGQDIRVFGEWRSLAQAQQQNSVIYVHRGTYSNEEGLLYKE